MVFEEFNSPENTGVVFSLDRILRWPFSFFVYTALSGEILWKNALILTVSERDAIFIATGN